MQVLRRPETAQGTFGYGESGNSSKTRTVDADVAAAVRNIRGEQYFSAIYELIGFFEEPAPESEPIDPRTFANARDLLEALPHGYAIPEVGVDPDGEIALDWIRRDRTIVSVSVGISREVSYAAKLRDETTRGVLRFGIGFPSRLVELLRRLYYPA
jgi:hypothetical protein